MRLFLILTLFATAVAGCQVVPKASDYRWTCSDRPYEAGRCDQATNWRISEFVMQR